MLSLLSVREAKQNKPCILSLFSFSYRRNLDYQEVLDALSAKGIAIRVASPKLVMEEVK